METSNKLISLTIPIEIIDSLESGVIFSHLTLAPPDVSIKNTLNSLMNLAGIRKKADKDKFKFETHVDSDKSEITYFYERLEADVLNHEIDKPLFEQTKKMVSLVIDIINTVNYNFDKGVTLTPTYDNAIEDHFQIEGENIKYKEKRTATVINNLLNLLPILPPDISLKSDGDEITIDQDLLVASPIRSRKLFEDTIEIDGKIDCAGSIPRRIRIQQAQADNNKAISEFLITTRCINFKNIRLLPEKSEVKIKLIKSTSTNQYNIEHFELIGSSVDSIEKQNLIKFLDNEAQD